MDRETLYCLKPHTYDMKKRVPGEKMLVRRQHVKVLIALKRATRDAPTVIPFPSSVTVDNPGPVSVEHGAPVAFDTKDAQSTAGSADDVRKAVRAEYKEAFGKDAHGRMSVEKMRAEIDKKKEEA